MFKSYGVAPELYGTRLSRMCKDEYGKRIESASLDSIYYIHGGSYIYYGTRLYPTST